MSGYVKINVTDRAAVIIDTVHVDRVPDLHALQDVVGGRIEPMFTVPSPHRKNVELTAYVNEEGLCIGLPIIMAVSDSYGIRPFAGSMVIIGLDSRGDKPHVLLSDEELEFFEQNIHTTPTPLFEYGIMVRVIIYPEGK